MSSEKINIVGYNLARRKYIAVFLIILLATILTQIFIQYYIYHQEDYSRVINLAGRQRMLSQGIAKYSLLLSLPTAKKDFYHSELDKFIKEFEEGHEALKIGNTSQRIKPPFTPEIRSDYEELDSSVVRISASAQCILNACDIKAQSLEELSDETAIFLHKMDILVFKLDKYTNQKIVNLSKIEYALFLFIALVLFIEIWWVLLPFQKRMMEMFREQLREEKLRSKLYHLAELGEIGLETVHEIRNFLMVIQGVLDKIRLENKLEPNSKQDHNRDLQLIQSNLQKVSEICNRMSKLSRIEEYQEFCIDELVSDLQGILENRLNKSSINFTVEVEENFKLQTNKTQLIQIIYNLVKNSMDALEKVEIKIISLKIIKNENHIRFLVTDTGAGISEAVKDRIMEPFFTTKGASKGMGLGLSLCSKISNSLGGKLELVQLANPTIFSLSIENGFFQEPPPPTSPKL